MSALCPQAYSVSKIHNSRRDLTEESEAEKFLTLFCRLWPVVVAAAASLPVRVVGGGAQCHACPPVLRPLAQAAASGAVADALPVVLLGSCAMGFADHQHATSASSLPLCRLLPRPWTQLL